MANKATEEQILYANLLNKGMLVGLLGLIVTFIIYGAGIMKPFIPLGDVQDYWVMPVSEYLEKSGMHAGWWWLSHMKFGDMLNFFPIALLSAATIFCYAAIIPGMLRKKDTAYVVLAILEILVLVVAASGILGAGGH